MAFDSTKTSNDLIKSNEYNNLIADLKGHGSRHASTGSDSLPADAITSTMLKTNSVGLDAFDESLDYKFTANINLVGGAVLEAPLDLDGNQLQDAGHEVAPNVSSNFLVTNNEVIMVDTSSNTITITLGSADVYEGSIVKVLDKAGNASANNITVDTENAETINGQNSAIIDSDFEALKFQSDGQNWFVTGRVAGGSI